MKTIGKIVVGIALFVTFVYYFNFRYMGHLVELTWNATVECVTGGTAASMELEKEIDNITFLKFIRLNHNRTENPEMEVHVKVEVEENGEEASGEISIK